MDGAIQGVMAAQQSALAFQISIAVAAKQRDAVEQYGEAVHSMLEDAAQISRSPHAGTQFDAQA